MKVRIVDSSDNRNWYHSKIGEIFEINEDLEQDCSSSIRVGDYKYIGKEDCKIVEEPYDLTKPGRVQEGVFVWVSNYEDFRDAEDIGKKELIFIIESMLSYAVVSHGNKISHFGYATHELPVKEEPKLKLTDKQRNAMLMKLGKREGVAFKTKTNIHHVYGIWIYNNYFEQHQICLDYNGTASDVWEEITDELILKNI